MDRGLRSKRETTARSFHPDKDVGFGILAVEEQAARYVELFTVRYRQHGMFRFLPSCHFSPPYVFLSASSFCPVSSC